MSDRGLIDLRQIWRFGISGDKPIVLVHIHSTHRHAAGQHAAARPALVGLRRRGLRPGGAQQRAQFLPDAAAARDRGAARPRRRSRRRTAFRATTRPASTCCATQEVAPSEKAALSSLARVVFTADGRPLEVQVAALREAAAPAPATAAAPRLPLRRAAAPRRRTLADAARAPHGDFDAAQRRVPLRGRRATTAPPRPWVNVIANAALRLPGLGSRAPATPGPSTAACTRSRPGRTTRCKTRPSSTTCCRTWTRASCCR